MERKIVKITGKRQITIPRAFYEKLHFDKEVECSLENQSLVLRPLGSRNVDLLRNLIARGYSGEDLIIQFQQALKEEPIVTEDETK